MNRLTVVTLGVADLEASAAFYARIFDTPPDREHEGVCFFPLPGCWISLFPFEDLAADISPDIPRTRGGFSGVTFAHNVRTRDEVIAVMERARAAGAAIAKEAQDTFWGGFCGYFADPDGYHWEVVWGPMFDFTDDGALLFKKERFPEKQDMRSA